MRLLLSKLIRRSPPSPPLQLLHFSTHYAPSSSHLLFASSVHHHHLWQHDNNTRYCSTLYLLSPHNCFSFSRRFSNQPDFPDSDKPLLPVRALISMLDSYHDLTGFPWWIIISSSALTMRLALFPLIVLQRKKLKRIGELLPKLPPAFPPPMSGRSFRDQISLFWKEKKAAGCPSLIWFFTSFAIQKVTRTSIAYSLALNRSEYGRASFAQLPCFMETACALSKRGGLLACYSMLRT